MFKFYFHKQKSRSVLKNPVMDSENFPEYLLKVFAGCEFKTCILEQKRIKFKQFVYWILQSF